MSPCWQNWPRFVVCRREGKLGSDVPSWCKHSKASGSQGPSSNPQGPRFSSCDLFHKIKRHVLIYVSPSLSQLFGRAHAHFSYTARPSRGITRVFQWVRNITVYVGWTHLRLLTSFLCCIIFGSFRALLRPSSSPPSTSSLLRFLLISLICLWPCFFTLPQLSSLNFLIRVTSWHSSFLFL